MLSKLGFALALAGLLGCGGLQTGKIPVDSPLNEFEPPQEGDAGDDFSDDAAWDIEVDDEPETTDVDAPEGAGAAAGPGDDATSDERSAGGQAKGATGGKTGKSGKNDARGAARAD